ncbi:UDP-N-acetylmuramoyl-L-alanine--D-glutamate ligase [Turneriella parva]|uniref:UDP-N-acetylmuramoylalanine--D-glutamate ligase n=1 Tax=Turneriella parva (strain ATCC BAA-1111 / DSM 21527 / NCTC 11395 / H) TaxID=869212 RepID=I4B877_TURPD|nr:UDP-N-acetylmuramoyl-L-alanine--D-glutamate ligase [Turneriella parva]AFM13484.1 UDP-N-acetylmuramoylalanine--D-glutamate ligase [Turneriella parva DSM 21527]
MAKRFLLIGAGGKTGESYARLLQSHGHFVLWYDKNAEVRPTGLDEGLLEHIPSDSLVWENLKDRFDVLTLTPGVPLRHPFVLTARQKGKNVISEVAYCAPYLKSMRIIGITGTDGKSTTTTLAAQLIRLSGEKGVECGNFGLPLSEIALNQAGFIGAILVCELSSYQLEEPGDLALDAAIYLNLAPDHLNRYSGIEEYGLAKWNIAKLLKPAAPLIVTTALLPENTELWQGVHPLLKFDGPVISIDTQNLHSKNFQIIGDNICDAAQHILAPVSGLAISGHHNLANLLFALEAVSALRASDLEAHLAGIVAKLTALPHRFESIRQVVYPQMHFINDSKATTTQAAITALENSAPPVFMLLGGQGKGESYKELGLRLKLKDAHALIYGECRNDMARDFREIGFEKFTLHENLFKAFHTAKRLVLQRGLNSATVLLAPAATSWDQFKSFEERGDYFRSLVAGLSSGGARFETL